MEETQWGFFSVSLCLGVNEIAKPSGRSGCGFWHMKSSVSMHLWQRSAFCSAGNFFLCELLCFNRNPAFLCRRYASKACRRGSWIFN